MEKEGGLDHVAAIKGADFSGGQKQRIAIAGVLAMKPDCIVLDEPTAMLDPVGRRDVMETIERLNREEGITIILITHDNSIAARASRIVRITDGRIVYDGPVDGDTLVSQQVAVGEDGEVSE